MPISLKPDPLVRAPRRRVEIVDIQRNRRSDIAQTGRDDGRHPGRPTGHGRADRDPPRRPAPDTPSAVTAPTSALNTIRPSSIRANARPAATSSRTRVRYSSPPSPTIGEIPTSSVNIAMLAGSSTSISSSRTRRTAVSGSASGGTVVTISGCRSRASRAGPHVADSSVPHHLDRIRRADDRRAPPALLQRVLSERRRAARVAADRDQVGAGVTQRGRAHDPGRSPTSARRAGSGQARRPRPGR